METARRTGGTVGNDVGIVCLAAGFLVVVFLVGLCAKSVLGSENGDEDFRNDDETGVSAEAGLARRRRRWSAVKRKLLNAVRTKIGNERRVSGEDDLHDTFVKEQSFTNEGGFELEGLVVPRGSPLWHHRILMGERCQFPDFSGLILYDEKGNPVTQDAMGP